VTGNCYIFGPQQQHHVVAVDVSLIYEFLELAQELQTSSLIPPSRLAAFANPKHIKPLKEELECQPRYWPKLERIA
jgi:hypothetical protein